MDGGHARRRCRSASSTLTWISTPGTPGHEHAAEVEPDACRRAGRPRRPTGRADAVPRRRADLVGAVGVLGVLRRSRPQASSSSTLVVELALVRLSALAATEHGYSPRPAAAGIPPVEPKPPSPRSEPGSVSTSWKQGPLDPLDDQLGDPVAAPEHHGLARVEVDHAHLDLAAIAGVDRAGRVDQADPVPDRQPGARVDERGVAVRQRDGDAGGQQRALARRQLRVDRGVQVGAGVAGMGVRRQRDAGVEPADQDVDASRVHLVPADVSGGPCAAAAAAATSCGTPVRAEVLERHLDEHGRGGDGELRRRGPSRRPSAAHEDAAARDADGSRVQVQVGPTGTGRRKWSPAAPVTAGTRTSQLT